MTMVEILAQAKRQLGDTTGLKPVGIVRAFRDNGDWHVEVEVLEMARVPSTTDLLGDYEVVLAEDGNMVRFARKRTRMRCEPVQEDTE